MGELKGLIVITVPDGKFYADEVRKNFIEGMDDALEADVESVEAEGTPDHVIVTVHLSPSDPEMYLDGGNREGLRMDVEHAYVVGTPVHFVNTYDHEVYVTVNPEFCPHRETQVVRSVHPEGFTVEHEECETCEHITEEGVKVEAEG